MRHNPRRSPKKSAGYTLDSAEMVTSYLSTPTSEKVSTNPKIGNKTFRQVMDEQLAAAKAHRKKRQASGQYANKDPFIKFLRQRVSRLNYGVKVGRSVFPGLDTEKFLHRYNDRRFGAALKNDQFREHLAAERTFYFWADHKASTAEILVNIDTDCGKAHGGGTTEGGWKFMELLRDRLFPGLYIEPSTNGEGLHGYFVLQKEGVKNDEVRRVLKQLDAYLKKLATSVDADIACVEVKGLPPSVEYDEKGHIAHITFGQFAKLPRGRGVLDTCKVKFGDLVLLDPDEIKVEPKPDTIKIETAKAGSKQRFGSFDSRVVRQDTLDKLPELEKYAEKLLRQWTGGTSFKADRWNVTATDMAQFFALMLCIKPRPDDSLPVRAVGRLWEEVYLAGDFSRPWNHHRFRAIRDLLSHHGHIDWVDFRFQNLPERKGRSCRWQLGMMLKGVLSSLLMGETTVVDTADRLEDGPYEFHTPRWFNFALDRQRRWLAEAEEQVEMLLAA